MKYFLLLAMLFSFVACDTETTVCGDGTEVQSDPPVCVYRSELLVETGFRCPVNALFRIDFGNVATVCSGTDAPPFVDIEQIFGERLGCPSRCDVGVSCRENFVTFEGDVCVNALTAPPDLGRLASREIEPNHLVVAALGGDDSVAIPRTGAFEGDGPLATVQAAVARAEPGQTIYLMPRNWDGERWSEEVVGFDETQIVLDADTPSGEEGAPISLESWPGTMASLEGDNPISIDGAVSYWQVGYLDLNYDSDAVTFEYGSQNSRYWRFHNIDANQRTNAEGIDGVAFYFGEGDFSGDSEEVPPNDYFVVEDCRIRGNGTGAAIGVQYARHVRVSRNQIVGMTGVWGAGVNGSDLAAADASAYELIMEDNFVVSAEKGGFFGSNHRWQIRNNIFFDTLGIVPGRGSVDPVGSSSVEISNNTVVGGSIFLDSDPNDLDFIDPVWSANIVVPFGEHEVNGQFIIDGTTLTLISDYNLTSETDGYGFVDIKYTLADWQIATGLDGNSLTGDPEFSSSDFSSPADFALTPGSLGSEAGPSGVDIGADVTKITSWWTSDLLAE